MNKAANNVLLAKVAGDQAKAALAKATVDFNAARDAIPFSESAYAPAKTALIEAQAKVDKSLADGEAAKKSADEAKSAMDKVM
jgi:hypothetical protein